ncbi:membrane protein [Paractinoplanes deccanensis]|uniref:Membrane protein n=1 Tax=Paractinoplanes deccanensis TaxID=113561 RepID=A0ABQ3Y4Z6_9ACTN|nr:low temperature requirement protein A [Actinoplanes deccanensis]GID75052.1 membrane protein [Actinoplanes deccanensis]
MSNDRQAPLIQPPRLRTDEERQATRLELFFDLAYVLVVAELAHSFADHLDLGGAATFAALITVTWWSWVTTTLYANRFDTNDVIYRLAKLAMTGAVIGMAASAQGATGGDGARFAACYLATRIILLLLYARAYRHVPEARHTIAIYLTGAGAAAVLWAASIPVEGTARYVLWAAGILVEAAAPLVATRLGDDVPLHLEHMPERFGLFVILVLGESIASLATGVHDAHWSASSVVSAVVAFTAVAALWWVYFDLGGAAGKRELIEDSEEDEESGSVDAYIYGHLPLIVGLAIAAVGIEQFVVHPAGELEPAARWALHGGVALYLVGVAVVMMGTSGRWRSAWPWPAAVIPVIAVIGFAEALEPVLAVAAITLVLVATVLAGIYEQRRGALRTTET